VHGGSERRRRVSIFTDVIFHLTDRTFPLAHIQTLEQTNRALTIEIIQLRRANAILQSGYASSRASQGLSPSTLPETVVRRLTDDKGNVLMGVDVDMLEASFGGGDGNGLGLVVKDDAGWDK
jgi:hypothetical protein